MSTTLTEFLLILPAELWIAVFSHLYLPDLLSVSCTCSSFRALAFDSLQEHRALHSRFQRVGGDDDDDYNAMYWYPLLLDILRNPVAGYYVEEVLVEEKMRLPGDAPFSVLLEDEALIREAVYTEEWIPEMKKEEFLDKLFFEDEDAMVTLMFLRFMPNLKRLGFTIDFEFDHLMPIVARIAQAASEAEEGDARKQQLPLCKLEHFQGQIFNCHDGVDFETIAPLMALPSLRTVCTPWNHEAGFYWPASLPKSRVREIEIPKSTVSREAIFHLARQGIRGPCMVRHEWGFRRYDDFLGLEHYEWDRLEIPYENAREEDWTLWLGTVYKPVTGF